MSEHNMISFNVGGRLFTTRKATIMSLPDTVLAQMISLCKEGDEPIFIDRDPDLFVAILEIYRHHLLLPPPNVNSEALQVELGFYGLDERFMIKSVKRPRKWVNGLCPDEATEFNLTDIPTVEVDWILDKLKRDSGTVCKVILGSWLGDRGLPSDLRLLNEFVAETKVSKVEISLPDHLFEDWDEARKIELLKIDVLENANLQEFRVETINDYKGQPNHLLWSLVRDATGALVDSPN